MILANCDIVVLYIYTLVENIFANVGQLHHPEFRFDQKNTCSRTLRQPTLISTFISSYAEVLKKTSNTCFSQTQTRSSDMD